MNFLEIVFTICAIADPSQCRNHHIALPNDASLTACVMQAMPSLAQWAGNNPGWTITSWRCEYSYHREEET